MVCLGFLGLSHEKSAVVTLLQFFPEKIKAISSRFQLKLGASSFTEHNRVVKRPKGAPVKVSSSKEAEGSVAFF